MDRIDIVERLLAASERIAKSNESITSQKSFIARLEHAGESTDEAETALRDLKKIKAANLENRSQLVRELERLTRSN